MAPDGHLACAAGIATPQTFEDERTLEPLMPAPAMAEPDLGITAASVEEAGELPAAIPLGEIA